MAEKHTSSRSKAGMGGGKKSSSKGKGKRIHRTIIEHHAKGGHTVQHFSKGDDGASVPEESDVMQDKNALMAHLAQTVPDNGAAQAAPTPDPAAQAQAGPPQAGPVAGPQPGM